MAYSAHTFNLYKFSLGALDENKFWENLPEKWENLPEKLENPKDTQLWKYEIPYKIIF